jgi:hypothetical protein
MSHSWRLRILTCSSTLVTHWSFISYSSQKMYKCVRLSFTSIKAGHRSKITRSNSNDDYLISIILVRIDVCQQRVTETNDRDCLRYGKSSRFPHRSVHISSESSDTIFLGSHVVCGHAITYAIQLAQCGMITKYPPHYKILRETCFPSCTRWWSRVVFRAWSPRSDRKWVLITFTRHRQSSIHWIFDCYHFLDYQSSWWLI